jgi:hypothetical protein
MKVNLIPNDTDDCEGDRGAPVATSLLGEARSRRGLILFIVLSVTFWLCFAMITPNRFGDYGDDGLYVSAAKALATGQGYTIISLPQEQPQTLVPPFYPLLLSLIWRAHPQFPDNIVWMMMLSAIATLSFLALTYHYLTRQAYATQWQAVIVVALAGINWRTMLHGTSVMSEMLYAALAVGALYLSEKYEKEETGHVTGIWAGVMMGLAAVTRSSGIALLMAVLLYLMMQRKWKKAVLAVGVASLFVLVWMVWSYANRTTAEGTNALYYAGYSGGINQTISDLQMLNETSKFTTIINVIGTNILLLVIGSIPLACLGLRFDLPQALLVALVLITIILIGVGFIRQCGKRISLLCLYVILYLAIHIAHPGIAYDRYIVPITPFLLFFLVSELAVPISMLRREFISGKSLTGKLSAGVITFALLIAGVVVIYGNGSAIYESLSSLKRVSSLASEHMQVIGWIKAHTNNSDILVCNRDTIYYLYTGRKATPSFQLSMLDGIPYQSRQPEGDEITRTFVRIIAESKGKYLISDLDDFADVSEVFQKTITEYVRNHPEKFARVFESVNKNSIIYRIDDN